LKIQNESFYRSSHVTLTGEQEICDTTYLS
jgi:hypothetical protein